MHVSVKVSRYWRAKYTSGSIISVMSRWFLAYPEYRIAVRYVPSIAKLSRGECVVATEPRAMSEGKLPAPARSVAGLAPSRILWAFSR
jgi:hypothetical protein